MKIKEIYDFIDSFAPYDTQCSWDNSGLNIGSLDSETKNVMLALDCTNDVISQAAAADCGLIITHHPLIFTPLKAIEKDSPEYNAAKSDIAVLSAHTNLDMANGGVNDVLCDILNIQNRKIIIAEGKPLMRMGSIKKQSAAELAEYAAKALNNSVKLYDSMNYAEKIAVCGGAGGEYVRDVFLSGCDTFITGEAKHHEYLEAEKLGINLITAGHFATEYPVINALRSKLEKAFPDICFFSAIQKCPYKTVI